MERMELGKFQINQLALLNGTGRHSRLLRGLLRGSSLHCGSTFPGIRGSRSLGRFPATSGQFVSFGRLGLAVGRLVSLRRAALAGPGLLRRFFRLRLGVLRLFRFRGTATARLFGLPLFSGRMLRRGSPGLLFRGRFRFFHLGPGRPALIRHERVNLIRRDDHIAGLGRLGLLRLVFGSRGLTAGRISRTGRGSLLGFCRLGPRVQFFICHSLTSFS